MLDYAPTIKTDCAVESVRAQMKILVPHIVWDCYTQDVIHFTSLYYTCITKLFLKTYDAFPRSKIQSSYLGAAHHQIFANLGDTVLFSPDAESAKPSIMPTDQGIFYALRFSSFRNHWFNWPEGKILVMYNEHLQNLGKTEVEYSVEPGSFNTSLTLSSGNTMG